VSYKEGRVKNTDRMLGSVIIVTPGDPIVGKLLEVS
jgi:hypothetical protein